jgi:PIN domain nuclease of toxin-antitoxin system
VRLLLDTNIIIWALNRSERLKQSTLVLLQDPANELYCSVISIWEISIKQSINKLNMPDSYLSILGEQNIGILNITVAHAYAVRSLPRLHNDPFDRMLVVQAMIEDLTLMTHDKQLPAYAVSCMMV